MRRLKTAVLATALSLLPLAAAHAACSVEGQGEVNVLSNSIPVFTAIQKTMEECAREGLKITFKQTREHYQEHALFSGAKSPYDMAGVANETLTPQQAAGVLLPLNDLVDKYRDKYKIEDSMLIKVGDEVLAIAFMVNSQHLFYRKDVLEAHGLQVPTSYDEVLAAAEKLKGDPSIQFPLGGTYKSGWNLAQEFTNNFLAMGGEFFKPGTAEPAFNSEAGVKTLELMKKLTATCRPMP
jgi:ABC-type glycerol-3-phosphate transport system substrate-binding protein